MKNSKLKQKTQGFGKIKNAVCRKSVEKKGCTKCKVFRSSLGFLINALPCRLLQDSHLNLENKTLNENSQFQTLKMTRTMELRLVDF